MQLFSPIKERILEYIDYKGISKYKFYQDTGITRGVLDKDSGISEENVARFVAYEKNVNIDWLITGRGKMLKTKSTEKTNKKKVSKKVSKNTEKPKIQKKLTFEEAIDTGIPLIPIDAMAGFGEGSFQIMDYDTSCYRVPEFDELKAEFMIRVKGSSMYPKYNSGDLLACKKLPLSDIFFQWNKVYVLSTEQGALVKRVKKSEKENCIKLISDNKKYDPFDLPISAVYSIALVLGVIRLE